MAVSLQDIAAQTNVSPVTVSRALRGIGRISPQTRENILNAARSMGYRSMDSVLMRPAVRSGRGEQCMRLVLPVFGDPHHADHAHQCVTGFYGGSVVRGIRQRLDVTDGELLIEHFKNCDEFERYWPDCKCSGIVLRQALPQAWLQRIQKLGPVVVAVPHDYHAGVDSVYTNEHRSAILAMDHLWERGHREIAWVGMLDRYDARNELERAFDSGAAADRQYPSPQTVRHAAWANLAVCQRDHRKMPLLLVDYHWSQQRFEQAANDALFQVLNLRPQPTAIVAAHDELAARLIDAAESRGLRVPDDLSIIGYGGDPDIVTDPQLTCVMLPMETMGRSVPELIERRLSMPHSVPVAMLLESTLREGASVSVVEPTINPDHITI
ncbi:MAG: LacI family DNA-binding transcriptional regulator [Planctomycetota bacterium]